MVRGARERREVEALNAVQEVVTDFFSGKGNTGILSSGGQEGGLYYRNTLPKVYSQGVFFPYKMTTSISYLDSIY